MTTYYVKGSSAKVNLTDNEFLASGGEKKIFVRGGTAYCIYHDPKNAIPSGKISELSSLKHPGVIVPTAELLDGRKERCGDVMKFVDDSWAPSNENLKPLVLCQMFTNAFRRKNGIENKHVVTITNQILEIVRYCHEHDVVLVDPNETNWIVRNDLSFTYLIDTSCLQTRSYPGTAIKPAIRDYTSKQFTRESDWYSIAIVLGWLWTGTHPYLAFHKSWEHMSSEAAMIPRMKEHFSFFRPGTEFSRASRPLEDIPSALREWLRAVLDSGKRITAPDKCDSPVASVTTSSKTIVQQKQYSVALEILSDYPSRITGVYENEVLTENDKHMAVIGHTPLLNKAIIAWVENGKLNLADFHTKEKIDLDVNAKQVFQNGGRIYSVGFTGVSEVRFNEVNGQVRASVFRVGNVADLPSTKVYNGCVIQNLLGKYLLSVFPKSGQCQQYMLNELNERQILDAKYESGILICATERGGNHRLCMYNFNSPVRFTELSTNHGDVNFAVTPKGIVAAMLPEGKLLLFAINSGATRAVDFPEPDMQLHSRDSRIVGSLDNRLYSVSVK